jgi:uncharacterized protein
MHQKYVLAFDEQHVLAELKHYLPSQAPLKDFIHHNTLHGFQHLTFHAALYKAQTVFGYKVYAELDEYRALYHKAQISDAILERSIVHEKGIDNLSLWKDKLLNQSFDTSVNARIGELRNHWKIGYRVNLDKLVHALLFRLVGNYLDQGISIWNFPASEKGFLESLRGLEKNSFGGLFSGHRAKRLLLKENCSLSDLLQILVGKEHLYARYLFDQQFAHPGWSGMVAVLEQNPGNLLDTRIISLRDFIFFELLLEIDALDKKFGENWRPLGFEIEQTPAPLFEKTPTSELQEVLAIWQNAREWSYYDQVLAGIQQRVEAPKETVAKSFQAMFCIDDRSCSIRRYIEQIDPNCATFGTPGHFNIATYFQPEHGKFYTKICPAPVQPKHIIVESETIGKKGVDNHFARQTHGLIGGWIISQTLGFWSAIRLAINIFIPSESPAMVTSKSHMDPLGTLSIERAFPESEFDGLQIGFTIKEMADIVEGLLKSIGLLTNFAPLVYAIGHGASSVNNTHYAGYDCGACSGRPGSVNARAIAFMANHAEVRKVLNSRGISIPEQTQFVGGLHDTTRDEISFFDLNNLSAKNRAMHDLNQRNFDEALSLNAKERARRFVMLTNCAKPEKVHKKVKMRAVSLFEPRPELNHATNCLCIVGRREVSNHLFLDRRSFLNSYNYKSDPEGHALLGILKAVAPVCGGINLEYYFSRNDNSRLGAGTKLPHNVMGLIGVANGMDGDLRTGLPAQMTEVHDPLRLLVIVEQYPAIVLRTIQQCSATYEWFSKKWVHLAVVDPDTLETYVFEDDHFELYRPLCRSLEKIDDFNALIESSEENFPVYKIA